MLKLLNYFLRKIGLQLVILSFKSNPKLQLEISKYERSFEEYVKTCQTRWNSEEQAFIKTYPHEEFDYTHLSPVLKKMVSMSNKMEDRLQKMRAGAEKEQFKQLKQSKY